MFDVLSINSCSYVLSFKRCRCGRRIILENENIRSTGAEDANNVLYLTKSDFITGKPFSSLKSFIVSVGGLSKY